MGEGWHNSVVAPLELRACYSHAYAMRPFPLTATSGSPGFPPPYQGWRRLASA